MGYCKKYIKLSVWPTPQGNISVWNVFITILRGIKICFYDEKRSACSGREAVFQNK